MGSMHAYEIDYVFGRPLEQPDVFSREEQDLSRMIMQEWTNFARQGYEHKK
jgi:carboxylesterase type B